ncbi:MAG: UDP-N-acetylmuramyl-tripeptide synthetase [Spirochaetaceae bacterium]|jgi:UDP-N-acetylmuramoyl-L-alanyl-D-glutamate--2,6-diaminopimelate ligase|nr:UDP-N-acetylmuramyl-tripeptide synthetase [Spirochaetaceae bacterium]
MEKRLSAFFDPPTAEAAGLVEMFRAPGPASGEDPLITSLEYDSRKVTRGSLYFALPGLHADGHSFIPDALRRGAAAVVYQHEIPQAELAAYSADYGPAVYLRVRDSRFAMSPAAASFWGKPSEHLTVIGVTGTEGKSTVTSLIWQLLRLSGKKAGFISTVQYSLGGDAEWNPEHQTTPEAPAVQAALAAMRENGAEYAVLESSSHGLSPRTNRLGDVAFSAGVMTNVTHEHLEFHGTWEQYRSDKANLFRALALRGEVVPAFGVVNADDPSADYFSRAAGGRAVYRYSVRGGEADLSVEALESGAGGNRCRVLVRGGAGRPGETGQSGEAGPRSVIIEDRLPGAFNAGNVLASLLVLRGLLGGPVERFIPLVGELKPVRGRMSAVDKGQPFEVLVDYAHTPSSFAAIFPPLGERIRRAGGRIISVFGSAGERDTAKRPAQGKIAREWSDIVVLTDEDPRGEDPMVILREIAAGCSSGGAVNQGDMWLIPDRSLAIRKAFSLARKGDLVLLLGKGHEASIIYEGHILPWDEIAEAERALGELGYGG